MKAVGAIRWPRLFNRMPEINIEHCPKYAGELKFIAAILKMAGTGQVRSHAGRGPVVNVCELRHSEPSTGGRLRPLLAGLPVSASGGFAAAGSQSKARTQR